MIRTFLYLLIFVYLLIPGYLVAQNNHLQLEPIRLPGQFPGAGIRMAIQDKAGLLWYFTNNGLYRYDGNELLYFGLNTQPALPYSPVYYLQPDGRGNLWIAFNKGAARFDLRNWTITPLAADDWQPNEPLDKNFTAMACLEDGSVYFAASSGKLYLVKQNKLIKVVEVSGTINNISEPVAGQLWLASDNGLINISIDRGQYGTPYYYRLTDANKRTVSPNHICYDSTGRFLFSANHTIFRGDVHILHAHRNLMAQDSTPIKLNDLITTVPLPGDPTEFFHSPFKIGNKYIGLVSGRTGKPNRVYTFDFNTSNWQLITPTSSIWFPGIISYISQYPGGAFVASSEGLTSISSNKLPLDLLLNGFENKNSIRAIYKKEDTLYIGSYRDGFLLYNEHTHQSKNLNPNLIVYSILPWNNDSLLLSDEGHGLFWYATHTNTLSAIPIENQETKQILKMATVLCRVNDSLVLEGTYQGVALINPLTQKEHTVSKGLLSQVMQNLKINAIQPIKNKFVDSLGQYLIATNSGLFVYNLDNGKVRYFFTGKAIRKTAIFSLLSMPEQTWMGSGGLGILAADSSGVPQPMNWLNSRLTGQIIYALTRCGNNVLIGTDKGLNVLHLRDSTITFYTTYDGLPADEFNQAAVYNDGNRAYLGTVNGIVRWKANSGRKRTLSRNVQIDNLTIVDANNTKTEYHNFPYLPPDSQHLIIPAHIQYFSLTFGLPEDKNSRLSYAYRLSPNDDWIDLGHKTEITFIKTNPGHYALQFAIKIPGGIWRANPFTFPLIIKPAFSQTLSFKLILALVFIGILFLIFHYREALRNKERNMRMKIAGDLHDEVGSSLVAIHHQNNRAMQSRLSSIDEISKPLKAIEEISEKALSVMGDIVWSIDARFDTRDAFVTRMKDYVYRLQSDLGISVNLSITGHYHDFKMHQAVRQNLFLIFKEAINNAIKYGDASPIVIQLHFSSKLVLSIFNNYNADTYKQYRYIQGGQGLTGMKRRAEQMNAKLQIKQTDHNFSVSIIL